MNALRRRRPLAALLAVVLLWVLAGCFSIPLTGPVGTIAQPTVADDEESSLIRAYGPGTGDDAASIVSGFLAAGADSNDDYEVARKFLTPDLALSWNPTAGSLIVASASMTSCSLPAYRRYSVALPTPASVATASIVRAE